MKRSAFRRLQSKEGAGDFDGFLIGSQERRAVGAILQMFFKSIEHPRTEPGGEIVTDQCHLGCAGGRRHRASHSFGFVPRKARFPEMGRPVSSAAFTWCAGGSNGCNPPGVRWWNARLLVLLCQKSVHGSTGSPRTDDNTSKFGPLAVRPELVEGRTAGCDTVVLGPARESLFPLVSV